MEFYPEAELLDFPLSKEKVSPSLKFPLEQERDYIPILHISPSLSTWESFFRTFFFFFLLFFGAFASRGGSLDGRPEAGSVSKSSSLWASTTSPIGSGLLDRYEYSFSESLCSSSLCNFFFEMFGNGLLNESVSCSNCLRDFLKEDFLLDFHLQRKVKENWI